MLFKRKQPKKTIWTETAIRLYERQMEAREKLGDKYICHPKNDVRRVKPLAAFYSVPFEVHVGPRLRVVK